MYEELIVHSDGGSRGNPGPGAGGFVLKDLGGNVVYAKGVFLGEVTNNEAEYMALLNGLLAVKEFGARSVKSYCDSEVVVRQVNGQYKVKSTKLKGLYSDCMDILAGFEKWQVTHVRRDDNQYADEMANRAMDARKDVEVTVGADVCKGKKVSLGVLVSGGGRTLANIQKEIDTGKLNAEVAVVICSRSQIKGVELAKEMGFRTEIVRKKDFADIGQFSSRIVELLDSASVDLVIQAGWLCLWQIPEKYNRRVMNIHPALLPSFGGQGMWGSHVHEAVLKEGCKVSGCTVHFCTDEYDRGEIIVQRCCEVLDDDDAESLAKRVFQEECLAYPEAIRKFCENRI